MRGLAGSRAAKVRHFFGLCKDFEEKVRKWRWFLTDVGCIEMQNAASANQSSRDRGQVRVMPPRFFVTFEFIFLNIPAGQ